MKIRPIQMVAVDHLFARAHLLSNQSRTKIGELIKQELMRREDHNLPPLSNTFHVIQNKPIQSIHDAAEKGDLNRLRYLIEYKEVWIDRRRDGNTALISAIRAGQTDTALYLITQGGDVNLADALGCTPLHHAVDLENIPVARKLLDKHAIVSKIDRLGRTAIYYAAVHGNFLMLRLLIPHHSIQELNKAANDQTTPLHAALIYQKHNAARELTICGLNFLGSEVDFVDNEGMSALHYAAKNHYHYVVKALIDKGAKVNHQNKSGDTPLHLCSSSPYTCQDTLMALYKGGNSDKIVNKEGETPLHKAIKANNFETFKWLLQHDGFLYRWLLRHDLPISILDNVRNELRGFIKKHGNEMILEYFERYLEEVRERAIENAFAY